MVDAHYKKLQRGKNEGGRQGRSMHGALCVCMSAWGSG